VADIHKVEEVERTFTKGLYGCYKLSYRNRLTRSNLASFEVQCLRLDPIRPYKISLMLGLTDIDPGNLFTFTNSGHCTRGRALWTSPISHCCADLRNTFFAQRAI